MIAEDNTLPSTRTPEPSAVTSAVNMTVRPEPWMRDAACRTVDPDTFFPWQYDEDAATRAKAVCAACPVREACLEYALRECVTEGIWGGLTASERRELARHRGIRTRPVPWTRAERETRDALIRRMRRDGIPNRAIADTLGMSVGAVWDVRENAS